MLFSLIWPKKKRLHYEEENESADGLNLGTLPKGISGGNETVLTTGAKEFEEVRESDLLIEGFGTTKEPFSS